jgi:hypothetical protein
VELSSKSFGSKTPVVETSRRVGICIAHFKKLQVISAIALILVLLRINLLLALETGKIWQPVSDHWKVHLEFFGRRVLLGKGE